MHSSRFANSDKRIAKDVISRYRLKIFRRYFSRFSQKIARNVEIVTQLDTQRSKFFKLCKRFLREICRIYFIWRKKFFHFILQIRSLEKFFSYPAVINVTEVHDRVKKIIRTWGRKLGEHMCATGPNK